MLHRTLTDVLDEHGEVLPEVATPVAAYVPATRVGPWIYVSGQLPMVEGVLPATGHVPAEVPAEEAYRLARRCALNALAAIVSVAPEVARQPQRLTIVKLTGFVASSPGFTGQPQVVNGASELFAALEGPPHARSAVGVAELPLGAPVEIEVIAHIRDE